MYSHPVYQAELAHQHHAELIHKAQQYHRSRIICETRNQNRQPLLYQAGVTLVALGEWLKRRNRWPAASPSTYQI